MNEVYLSIYTKDNLYSLVFYSFNHEALYFTDKFSDCTLDYEIVTSFVKQLKPTLCLLNLNTKTELQNKLVEAMDEVYLITNLEEDEELSSDTTISNQLSSTDLSSNDTSLSINLDIFKSSFNKSKKSQFNSQQPKNISTSSKNEDQPALSTQNNLISTSSFNKKNRLTLLTYKFYVKEICKKVIYSCNLNKDNIFNENDKHIYISSIINVNDDFFIKSIGSLFIFINQNNFGIKNNTAFKGINLKKFEKFGCQNYVIIDQITLNELNVFSYKDHPSIFKKDFCKKEDTSLFSLFNKCKSKVGTNYLRRLFFQPINCFEKLNERLDDIEVLMNLSKDALYFYYSCLKNIKPIATLVEKMKICALSPQNFITFATTIENLIVLNEFVSKHDLNLNIYDKLKKCYTVDLETIIIAITSVINLEKSKEEKKIEINSGINSELDQMKLEFENIEKTLELATDKESERLKDFLPSFEVTFNPVFGFVLQIANENLMNEKIMLDNLPDVKFVSSTIHFKYFKSKNLEKFDESYNIFLTDILVKQNSILLDLQNQILLKLAGVFDFLEVVGEFDWFAQIAKLRNYVRPNFNFENIIDIKNGRHPLKEALESYFVPNDYYSKYPKSIKIITGTNNSGKSVFLKQNCLLIYMAYLGSFVPADYCNIPLFSKILTKIESIESISIGLSSFTNDLCRLSNIINKIPYNALVVIDEFGKGTSFEDGLSLFAAYINFITKQNPKSHFIISTHIHSLPKYLENIEQVNFQQLEIKFENNEIFYTHKLIDGLAEFSYPLELAKKINFDSSVINRAKEIKDTGNFLSMKVFCQKEFIKRKKIDHLFNSAKTEYDNKNFNS